MYLKILICSICDGLPLLLLNLNKLTILNHISIDLSSTHTAPISPIMFLSQPHLQTFYMKFMLACSLALVLFNAKHAYYAGGSILILALLASFLCYLKLVSFLVLVVHILSSAIILFILINKQDSINIFINILFLLVCNKLILLKLADGPCIFLATYTHFSQQMSSFYLFILRYFFI